MNMQLAARVVRIGNSRGLILPMALAKAMGFEVGQELTLESSERGITIVLEKKEEKR